MVKYRKTRLWVYLLLALLPMILVVGVMVVWVQYARPYKEFTIALLDDIQYATEHDCLRAELDGVNTRLTEHNAQKIHNLIMHGHFSKYLDDAPESDDFLLLDFGNGDTIKVWAKDNTTWTVQYIPAEGEDIIFPTNDRNICRFIDLERLTSLQWGNGVWYD